MAKVREHGIIIGSLKTGRNNCITDVKDVKVGHKSLYFEDGKDCACTGVTAILPHGGNLFKEKVVAAVYVINGFGKAIGSIQIDELGTIESPIMLTNTLSVPEVAAAAVEYMLKHDEEISSVNVVVGECNDSKLNSIRKRYVSKEHAGEALKAATDSTCEEGAVGAGMGMVCFGYKGGIGCSSRLAEHDDGAYTVGVLTLTNFGKPEQFKYLSYTSKNPATPNENEDTDGSIMIILATDAPLSDRQLKRVAKRAAVGLARTGGNWNHGSGDIVIAFSTANKLRQDSSDTSRLSEPCSVIRENDPVFNELFSAAADATEEAILNSLSQAKTIKGKEGTIIEKYDFSD